MSDETRHVTPDAPRTLSEKPFPLDPHAPISLSSLRGSAPNLTHGLRSEDYVRMQRDLDAKTVAGWRGWAKDVESRRKQGCSYTHFVTIDEMKAILSLIEFAGLHK